MFVEYGKALINLTHIPKENEKMKGHPTKKKRNISHSMTEDSIEHEQHCYFLDKENMEIERQEGGII